MAPAATQQLPVRRNGGPPEATRTCTVALAFKVVKAMARRVAGREEGKH